MTRRNDEKRTEDKRYRELLSSSEIQSLRQEAKETSAYARKAFAHLRPENKKADDPKT